jgi:hypothetical protein
VASPVFADPDGRPHWGDREESRGDRSQSREERQQAREQVRAEPQERAAPPAPPVVEQVRTEPAQRAGGVSRWTRDTVQQPGDASRWTRDPSQRSGETARWTRDRVGGSASDSGLRQSDRPVPNVMRVPSPLIVSGTPRQGTQPALRADARRRTVQWSSNWRRDSRYDWRGWRDRHGSTFHVGIYYDPFGWSYQPYQVGWRLWPSYYGRQYWIDDPWQYRLPYAPPGTVWVRYWDDALLVDTWSGQVVDVIQGFFW